MQLLKQMHLESLPISQRCIYEGDEWEVFDLFRNSNIIYYKPIKL